MAICGRFNKKNLLDLISAYFDNLADGTSGSGVEMKKRWRTSLTETYVRG